MTVRVWTLLLLSLVGFPKVAQSQGSAEVATGFAAGNHFVVSSSGDLWQFGQFANPAGNWYGRATDGLPPSPVVGAFYANPDYHRFFAVLANGDVHAFGDHWVFDSAHLVGNVFRGASGQTIAAAFYSESYRFAYAVARDGDVWRWRVQESVFDPQYVGNIFGAMPTTVEPTTWGRVRATYRN